MKPNYLCFVLLLFVDLNDEDKAWLGIKEGDADKVENSNFLSPTYSKCIETFRLI